MPSGTSFYSHMPNKKARTYRAGFKVFSSALNLLQVFCLFFSVHFTIRYSVT